MTNMQAAIGCGELAHLEKYVHKKKWMAGLYGKLLQNVPGIILPKTKNNVGNVYWMYAILVDKNKFGMNRDELRSTLKEHQIDTRDFFYSPEEQPVLIKFLKGEKFPNAKYIGRNGLLLPSGLAITEQQIRYVCKKIVSQAQ